MRLLEIEGNTDGDVIQKLMIIRRVINQCANMIAPSNDLKELAKRSLNSVNTDSQNLLFWVSTNRQIEKLYREINQTANLINW